MRKLETLVQLLSNHPALSSAASAKRIIERHPEWLMEYRRMLSLQKRLVRQTVDDSKQAKNTQKEIDQILKQLQTIPVVDQYLDSLNELQEDFHTIADILNQELSRQ